MAKSKTIILAQHRSCTQIFTLMDRLFDGWQDFDGVLNEVEQIKSSIKTPLNLYFDSMASVSRFFDVPFSTVKSAMHRGTTLKNGYSISRISVLYNLEENRGKHFHAKPDDSEG